MITKCFLLLVALVVALGLTGTGGAVIAPPWCGTPTPDAAAALPDGGSPSDPPGSFPHIPYYAIGCTLESIASRSNGRMTVEVIGRSALGRHMYRVSNKPLGTKSHLYVFTYWQNS